MKAGIIGMGTVGRAATLAAMQRGSAAELVLVNRHPELSEAVALDMHYGAPVGPAVLVRSGDYEDLAGSGIVIVTAGVNEKHGGATNRADPAGRLRLLQQNAGVIRDIVPQVAKAAPKAVIVIATDPPDPLADLARLAAPGARIVSAGTWLDSLRFRTELAEALGANPRSVQADVLGEHGTSELFHWSGATVGGVPWRDIAAGAKLDEGELRKRVEDKVRFANINIIDVTGASQYGIGIVIARMIEAVLRDEKLVVPIGSFQSDHGVTYSLPSILGADGVEGVFQPRLDAAEAQALESGIARLKQALADVQQAPAPAPEPQPA